MQKFLLGLLIGSVMLVTGCAKSASPVQQQAGRPPTNDPIALIAYEFLEAVRSSDNDTARAKLTPLAIQRMAELGMDFMLPISETAQFSVSNAELIEADIAAVDTVWTEIDASGQPFREELTVVLKSNQGRWGIMAMLAGMGPNQEPDGIDFEKPNQPFNFAALASEPAAGGATSVPSNSVPQQATRPAGQDPFRQ
ncbi:MAG: hypothetical protein ACR2NM_17445 [Bythopirellula sp.]